MNYLLVLLLPAVFFGMTGLMVREVHKVEQVRAVATAHRNLSFVRREV